MGRQIRIHRELGVPDPEHVRRKALHDFQLHARSTPSAATRRMEVLEWIIIVLIALSIVLPFLPGLGGK